jgi:hypothetical protein
VQGEAAMLVRGTPDQYNQITSRRETLKIVGVVPVPRDKGGKELERTVDFQGRRVQGTEVGFDTIREEWNEYALRDGTTIKVKTVLTNVVRLNGEHDPQGDPVYVVKSNNQVVCVEIPDHLRKI